MLPCSLRTRRGTRTRTSWPWRPRASIQIGSRSLATFHSTSQRVARSWTRGNSAPGMLGLRFTFPPPHQSSWPTDGTIDWLWPAAERAGLPIALMAAGFLPKVAEVAQRHPNLKLILDHLGRPSGGSASQPGPWANLPEGVALAG